MAGLMGTKHMTGMPHFFSGGLESIGLGLEARVGYIS